MPAAKPPTPQSAAERAYELARDARATVVLDGRGELAGSSEPDHERARSLAELTADLLEAVDGATRGEEPPEQVEVQVDRGAVYEVRRADWTLAAVARRQALSSLMFYDLRAVLSELEQAA